MIPNQGGTHGMWEHLLSSVGEQDMDTSGYQASSLDDFDIFWEIDQLELHVVLFQKTILFQSNLQCMCFELNCI